VPFFAVFAKALVETLAPAPDWHVVDVGSGRGAVVFELAPLLPTGHITAIDLAEPMVQALGKDLEERGVTGVDVQVGDVEALNLDNGSADAVTASMVLFFLPDLDGGLRQIRRVLTPVGVLAFSVFAGPDPAWIPVYDAFLPYLPTPVRSGNLSRPSHEALSSVDDIRRVVGTAGFNEVEVTEVHHDIRFESVEQWHAWSWSIGLRGIWAGMAEPVREQARAAVLDEVQRLAKPDGSIVERFAVRYVRALATS
jgi:ubiquinone/menaquinone biosynthesis C-methylase UbiE